MGRNGEKMSVLVVPTVTVDRNHGGGQRGRVLE